MKNIDTNSQVDGKAVKASSNNNQSSNQSIETKLATKRKQAMDEAVKMSRSVYCVFEVNFQTISRRINAAKRKQSIGRETVAAKRVKLDYAGQRNGMYVYVDVVRTADEYGCVTPTVVLRATTGDNDGDVLAVKQAVNYTNTRKYEETFVEVLGAVMTKAIAAAYADEATRAKLTKVIALREEQEYENEHYWDNAVEKVKNHIEQRLVEVGYNPLMLADALVEAYKNTDGAVYYGEVPTLALWVSYKAEIVRRLESISNWDNTPTPCLEDEKPVETPNENSGNPAPGLREQLEDILAADWAQMGDSPLEGYIGEHHMGGRYLVQTTRELWLDAPYMGVRLIRLGDGHEESWRIHRDGDIPGVADNLWREMHANE